MSLPPLDPDAAKLLDLLAQVGVVPPHQQTPEAVRTQERRTLRTAPPPFVSVGEVRGIEGDWHGQPVRGRLYRPHGAAADAALPGLVYFHGGGWVVGSLDTHDHLCRALCRQAGIAVFSVDYPLAPEAPFPAAVDGAVAGFAWAVENAGALGMDPARIGAGGDSAGANLVAVLSLEARDRGGVPPRVQLLFYPAMDLTLGHLQHGNARPGDPFTPDAVAWFVDLYLGGADAADWRASPLLAGSLAGLPPAYVMTAGADVLAGDGRAFAARLQEAGVPVRTRHFPGQIHAFLRSPHLLPTAWTAIADAAEFLSAELCGFDPA